MDEAGVVDERKGIGVHGKRGETGTRRGVNTGGGQGNGGM